MSNCLDPAGNVHACQIMAINECHTANTGHTLRNGNRAYFVSDAVPRNIIGAGIVCHRAGAGDVHYAILAQCPDEVFAAGTGGNGRKLGDRLGLGRRRRGALGILIAFLADGADPVGVVPRVGIGRLLGRNLGQQAHVVGVIADGCGGQGGIAAADGKRLPLRLGTGVADGGQIPAFVKGMVADGGKLHRDDHRRDALPVRIPGRGAEIGVAFHPAAAGEDHHPILAEHPFDTFAAGARGNAGLSGDRLRLYGGFGSALGIPIGPLANGAAPILIVSGLRIGGSLGGNLHQLADMGGIAVNRRAGQAGIATPDLDPVPIRLGTGIIHNGKTIAVIERAVCYAGEALGKCNRVKIAARIERTILNTGHALRDGHLRQAGTVLERAIPNGGSSARNDNACQASTAVEDASGNGCDLLRQGHAG